MLRGKELSELSLLDGQSFPVSAEDSCNNNVQALADNGNLFETFMYIGVLNLLGNDCDMLIVVAGRVLAQYYCLLCCST
jgi:hypothetical protein